MQFIRLFTVFVLNYELLSQPYFVGINMEKLIKGVKAKAKKGLDVLERLVGILKLCEPLVSELSKLLARAASCRC